MTCFVAYHSKWHTSPLSHKCSHHMQSPLTFAPFPSSHDVLILTVCHVSTKHWKPPPPKKLFNVQSTDASGMFPNFYLVSCFWSADQFAELCGSSCRSKSGDASVVLVALLSSSLAKVTGLRLFWLLFSNGRLITLKRKGNVITKVPL